MSRSGGRIEGLHLGDGATVHAGTVVNAAGTVPWDAVSKGSLQTGTVFFSVPKLF
jgi:tetrahydrodipicolinate N-succinyltransferase